MLEIVFLILAASGIAAYARGRGGNPWLFGGLAVAGYVLLVDILPIVARLSPDSDNRIWTIAGGVAWVGVIAFCARFLLGSGRKKPSGMWTCPNCKFLNQHYAIMCEACRQPYGEPVPKA
jgi:hypothetical protein